MEDYLSNLVLQPWHWWALAAILIGIEMLTPTFYFLWPGIAAAVVGVLLLLVPSLSMTAQLLIFAVTSVAATVLWKRYVPRVLFEGELHPTLNRRSVQYVGRKAKAAESFSGGRGPIAIDDTIWNAATEDGSNPEKGAGVEVIAANGTLLTVRSAP